MEYILLILGTFNSKNFIPTMNDNIRIFVDSTLNTLQIIGFDVLGTFQYETLSIPNEFGLPLMTIYMNMDG